MDEQQEWVPISTPTQGDVDDFIFRMDSVDSDWYVSDR